MKKSILVPTDFSNNAWIAISFAANLAMEKDKDLIVLHTFFPFYSGFTSMEHNVLMFEEAEAVALAEMKLVEEKLDAEFPELSYETLCLEGGLSEVIDREKMTEKYELIVMGTKGASGLQYTIMGSNTFDVINKTDIPVLAVPDKAAYAFKKLGVLTNYKRTDISILAKFTNILGFDYETVLMHVHEDDDGFEQTYAEAWKKVVQEEAGLQNVSVKIGKGEKLQKVVNEMLVDEEIDVLLVTNNAKSFIKKLFTRNLVKSLALKPQVPILFIKP